MRWSLYARSLTAALLVTSAALALLGAAERWLTACGGILSWETEPCIRRQDHLYDSVIPTEPWLSSGDAAEFLGLAYLLLAAAVVLTPAALGRRSTWWQALSVAVVGIVLASVGALTLASGLAGEVVAIPAVELLSLLFYLVPPFVVALGLFPRDADDRDERALRLADCVDGHVGDAHLHAHLVAGLLPRHPTVDGGGHGTAAARGRPVDAAVGA